MARKPPVVAGDIIAIPVESGFVAAKALFVSSYVKDLVLLSLGDKKVGDLADVEQVAPNQHQRLYYSRVHPVRIGQWAVVARQEVSASEHALSKRIDAGEVWLADEYLGPARDEDERTLPRMLVYGEKLIEKYAANV
jgi:hypothetical protein